ncbi:MAG: four helix bundle protein [Clostridia bacterium]|nr:four helix bundle protein [Clostridia bacterium]
MTESPLIIKSKEFALAVIKVCKELRNAKCESALINQFLRSGTSIGANINRLYQHRKGEW